MVGADSMTSSWLEIREIVVADSFSLPLPPEIVRTREMGVLFPPPVGKGLPMLVSQPEMRRSLPLC